MTTREKARPTRGGPDRGTAPTVLDAADSGQDRHCRRCNKRGQVYTRLGWYCERCGNRLPSHLRRGGARP